MTTNTTCLPEPHEIESLILDMLENPEHREKLTGFLTSATNAVDAFAGKCVPKLFAWLCPGVDKLNLTAVRISLAIDKLSSFADQRQAMPSSRGNVADTRADNGALKIFARLSSAIDELASFVDRLQALPSSPAYEALFLSRGRPQNEAELIARAVLASGRNCTKEEAKGRNPGMAALCEIAKRHGKTKATARQAAVIQNDNDCKLDITRCFEAAKIPHVAGEFWRLIPLAAKAEANSCHRIVEIVGLIKASLPTSRGRKASLIAMTHRGFLHSLERYDGPSRYTYSDIEGDFTDDATDATRREFGVPKFDPRSAAKSLREMRKAEIRPN